MCICWSMCISCGRIFAAFAKCRATCAKPWATRPTPSMAAWIAGPATQSGKAAGRKTIAHARLAGVPDGPSPRGLAAHLRFPPLPGVGGLQRRPDARLHCAGDRLCRGPAPRCADRGSGGTDAGQAATGLLGAERDNVNVKGALLHVMVEGGW